MIKCIIMGDSRWRWIDDDVAVLLGNVIISFHIMGGIIGGSHYR